MFKTIPPSVWEPFRSITTEEVYRRKDQNVEFCDYDANITTTSDIKDWLDEMNGYIFLEPTSKTQASFDGVIVDNQSTPPTVILLQMTRSTSHGIKTKGLDQLLLKLRKLPKELKATPTKKWRFIFVCRKSEDHSSIIKRQVLENKNFEGPQVGCILSWLDD